MERFLSNLERAINNMVDQFRFKTIITKEHRSYYSNYYLKGKKHKKFTSSLDI